MISEYLKRIYNVEIEEDDIIFEDSCCGYSWGFVLIIFRDKDKYYYVDDFDVWEPQEITEDEALELMEEYDVASGQASSEIW